MHAGGNVLTAHTEGMIFMKRRTLDFIFSVGGLGAAALLVVLGLVMASNANFAKNYVHDQLVEQKIAFPPRSALSEEELASPCISANAGKSVATGKQAECYANDFIGLHVKSVANGATYAELGSTQSALRAQLAAAKAAESTDVAAVQSQLDTVSAQRETLFKGETLRGLLLTSYGFSVFGVKASEAANVANAGAALMVLLSLAGLGHAFRTGEAEAFAPVATPARSKTREPVHA